MRVFEVLVMEELENKKAREHCNALLLFGESFDDGNGLVENEMLLDISVKEPVSPRV